MRQEMRQRVIDVEKAKETERDRARQSETETDTEREWRNIRTETQREKDRVTDGQRNRDTQKHTFPFLFPANKEGLLARPPENDAI